MLNGSLGVKFNKGEAYLYKVDFTSNADLVTEVYISCASLDFCHALTQETTDTSVWHYLFDKDETNTFTSCVTTYTLTVHSSDNNLEPQKLVNQEFIINADKNPQTC
jgi:hypothetical protein